MIVLGLHKKRSLNEEMKIKPSRSVLLIATLLMNYPMVASFAFSSSTYSSKLGSSTRYARAGLNCRKSTAATPRLERLQFRNGDEDEFEYTQNKEVPAVNRWWGTLIPATPKSEEAEASQRVGEYLEFLNKRNRQIRENDQTQSTSETEKESKKSSLSVMRWLSKDGSECNRVDALFALGLAAKRVESLAQPAMKDSFLSTAVSSLKSSTLFQKVSRSRNALLHYQTIKLRLVAIAVANFLKSIPDVPAMLIKVGGSPKPLASLLAAIFPKSVVSQA